MATASKMRRLPQDEAAPPSLPFNTPEKSEQPGSDVEHEKRSPSPLKQRGMKKYQIVVPESLFEEIEKIAHSRQTTVIDIIRRFLKLGLLTTKIENTPNAGLFIREGDSEREIILL